MKKLILAMVVVMIALGSVWMVFADPSGAITGTATETTRVATSAGSDAAHGGNISSLDLSSESQTQRWQGYHGNVSGNLTLDDANNNTLYRWTISSASGEVYAARSASTVWSGATAETDGASGCAESNEEALTGTGNDRLNNTMTVGGSSASDFNVGTVTITEANACGTDLFDEQEAGSADWPEVLITDGVQNYYVGILNDNTQGFDGNYVDYQLIVPEDGTTAATTDYYFWIEFS